MNRNEWNREMTWRENIRKEREALSRQQHHQFTINPYKLQQSALTLSVSTRGQRFLDKDAAAIDAARSMLGHLADLADVAKTPTPTKTKERRANTSMGLSSPSPSRQSSEPKRLLPDIPVAAAASLSSPPPTATASRRSPAPGGNIREVLTRMQCTPVQKFSEPMTASQEVGWNTRRLVTPTTNTPTHNRVACEETKYVSGFSKYGQNPFTVSRLATTSKK
eukprot:PhM_4_TR10967/c0_g1_i1/m.85492